MPLAVILGAVAVVLAGIAGISVFHWRIYVRPLAGEVGVVTPGAPEPPASAPVSWMPIALVGAGLLLILARR